MLKVIQEMPQMMKTVAIMEIHPVGKTMEIGEMKIRTMTVHVVRDQVIGIAIVVIKILHRVTNVKNVTKLSQEEPVLQMVKK